MRWEQTEKARDVSPERRTPGSRAYSEPRYCLYGEGGLWQSLQWTTMKKPVPSFPLVTFSEGPTLPAVSQTPRELLLLL